MFWLCTACGITLYDTDAHDSEYECSVCEQMLMQKRDSDELRTPAPPQ